MAEIQLTRIRSIYGDIKGLLSQLPLPEVSLLVNQFIVKGFNASLDELSQVSNTDYSSYKVPANLESPDWPGEYDSKLVRAQVGRVISRLEEEFGFGKRDSNSQPTIAIFNKNQNSNVIEINYTINDLIEKQENDESKEKLKELKAELEKEDKDWDAIKKIIIWLINFSKDLFIQIIPIILQKKL